jgi:hypothetical protein
VAARRSLRREGDEMRFGRFTFGSIEVDGKTYEHDLVVDRRRLRKRRKGPSKPFRQEYGHTPLSLAEDIPWNCTRLVIGTGANGALPVMDDVAEEAKRRGVQLVVLPTSRALEELQGAGKDTNAILHVTC